MSTKKKKAAKAAATGKRYSDATKKQVVDFVAQYNSEHGRGGQSAAAKKFNVTPLTISTWLKAAGAKKPARKAVKAASKKGKAATKAATKVATKRAAKKGVRYSPAFKQEVIDFVKSYNEAEGRGGQNQAAKKFKLSVLTVSSWLKAAGVKNPARKPAKVKAAQKAAKKAGRKTKAKKAARKVAGGKGLSEVEALKAAIRKLIDA